MCLPYLQVALLAAHGTEEAAHAHLGRRLLQRKKPGRKPKKPKLATVESANGSVPETRFIDVNETLGRRKVSSSSNAWSDADKGNVINAALE